MPKLRSGEKVDIDELEDLEDDDLEMDMDDDVEDELDDDDDPSLEDVDDDEKADKPKRDSGLVQQLNQERANNARMQQTLATIQSERDTMKSDLAELKGQLKGLQKEANEKPTLDPNESEFSDLVNAVNSLQASLNERDSEIAGLRETLDSINLERTHKQAQTAQEKMIEGILSFCDEEYGPEYRNDADALAVKWVDAGQVKAPKTEMDGLKLMRKAYKAVKAKAEKRTKTAKPSMTTDTGESAGEYRPTRKGGSLNAVLSYMKKDKSWMKAPV